LEDEEEDGEDMGKMFEEGGLYSDGGGYSCPRNIDSEDGARDTRTYQER
jgi:hypothetical protein